MGPDTHTSAGSDLAVTALAAGRRFVLQHLSVIVAGLGLAWLLLALPALAETPNWAEDFEAYRAAAVRLAEEGTLYLAHSLTTGFEPQGQGLYLYPPPLGIAFEPFAAFAPASGAVLWYLFKIGALALAAALMPVRPATRLLAFGLTAIGFAAARDLTMGNVSTLLLVPLAAGWRWLDRPAGSVALALATSVRASMGAFLLWFAVRRQWRLLGWMIATGLATIALTLPFVGLDGYGDYFAMLGNVSGTGNLEQNRHVTALAKALGFSFYADARGGAGPEPTQQLLDFLHHKRLLLLMDNFEHLLEGVELVTAMLAIVLAAVFFFRWLFGVDTPLGWASVFVATTFFGGVILLAIGVLGEYTSVIVREVRRPPRWTVRALLRSAEESPGGAPHHADGDGLPRHEPGDDPGDRSGRDRDGDPGGRQAAEPGG